MGGKGTVFLSACMEKIKGDKRLEAGVYGLLALLGILLYAASCGAGDANAPEAEAAPGSPAGGEAAIEERLADTLSCIRGAGKVRVMITYDTGAQLIPAMSTDVQSSTSQSSGEGGELYNEDRTESTRPATLQDGSLILAEKAPAVRGVIVIAEGAADVGVKLRLQTAVETVLGVESSRIEVFEMCAPAQEGKG